MLFDLDYFYNQCASGETVNYADVLNYIQSFKCVVLWGASFQGAALGKFLLDNGIAIEYWDIRSEQLKAVNGVKVTPLFSSEFAKEDTLVIFCIPNHVIMPELIRELEDHGYHNIIRGDILYSGTLCPFNYKTILRADKCWGTRECRSVICQRASSIIKNQNTMIKPGPRIDLTYCAFIINSICNLSCKHCVQFVNNYPLHARSNVPFNVIARDIDTFLETIDSVGTIAVMGGETFMHQDIGSIVKRFSQHKNFGFVSLPTNGLHLIKKEHLQEISDPRIVVSFGYYLHVATDQQKENYYANIELVKSLGLTYTESVQLPTWVIPSELGKLAVDEEYMKTRKESCQMPPRNLQVKNGKVHVCDRSVALHNMGIVDYPEDYLDLTKNQSLEQRRNELRALIDRPFYYTCGHCYPIELTIPSAIQGVRDVFKVNNSKIYEEN